MECTPAAPNPTSPTGTPVTASSLLAAFATVRDPRRSGSVTYPLAAILALSLVALLARQRSVLAIAEWASRQGDAVLEPLGLTPGQTPCQSTLQRLFAKLDGAALSLALQVAFAGTVAPDPTTRGGQAVAIDGKAQRGRLRFHPGGCPVHALTAFCHAFGVVLAQEAIAPRQDAEKGEAELTVAPALLDRLDWQGRVLTGDALFCQRSLCQQVLDAGGDYLLVVKENQPTLHADLQLLFDPPVPAPPLGDRREAHTLDRGHGRDQERRHLIASTDLTGYLDWPGLAQVFRLERTWREHGTSKRALHYGITSLPAPVAGAQTLLTVRRGHWSIENELHYPKDVTFGEDASLVHTGQGPTILAILRDTAISRIRLTGCRTIARRLRELNDDRAAAVALVTQPLPLRA
jgi:predicted transposase YbfD/YdcC